MFNCSMSEFPGLSAFIRPLMLVVVLAAPVRAQDSKADGPAATGPEKVVQEQVEAYNRHDLEAFLKTYSPEIKLYDFPDRETGSGHEVMRQRYGPLFKNTPDLKVRIARRIVQGDCVIDHEEVTLRGRQFTAVAIYRVKGDKITTVWFLK